MPAAMALPKWAALILRIKAVEEARPVRLYNSQSWSAASATPMNTRVSGASFRTIVICGLKAREHVTAGGVLNSPFRDS